VDNALLRFPFPPVVWTVVSVAAEFGDDHGVARNLGPSTATAAPVAVRAARPGWRDPRLWLGVAIVAICVVAGARLLGSADDTVAVWAVAADEPAGSTLVSGDLVAHRVRFADAGDLDGYFRVGDPLPDHAGLVRGVGAGELLPRGAVGAAGDSGLLQLPLAVDPAAVPAAVGTGSAVDVYVVGRGTRRAVDPAPVLSRVTVVAVVAGGALDGSTELTLAVPEQAVAAYFGRLETLSDPVVTVVGRPG
jgi:hypothetical protein